MNLLSTLNLNVVDYHFEKLTELGTSISMIADKFSDVSYGDIALLGLLTNNYYLTSAKESSFFLDFAKESVRNFTKSTLKNLVLGLVERIDVIPMEFTFSSWMEFSFYVESRYLKYMERPKNHCPELGEYKALLYQLHNFVSSKQGIDKFTISELGEMIKCVGMLFCLLDNCCPRRDHPCTTEVTFVDGMSVNGLVLYSIYKEFLPSREALAKTFDFSSTTVGYYEGKLVSSLTRMSFKPSNNMNGSKQYITV